MPNHKRKGATSILVIVMMVVLIVLGLAILTTSLSGVRLAQKKQLWLQSYYQLEVDSATALATIHQIVQEARLASPTKLDARTELIEDQVEEAFGTQVLKWGAIKNNMRELSLVISTTEEKPPKHITLQLLVSLESDSNQPPLSLVSYKQWQDAFEFKNLPGFDDPLTETPVFDLDQKQP